MQDKIPQDLPESLSVEDVFNLATIKGAKTVNMSKEIGRIAEGYKADLASFDRYSEPQHDLRNATRPSRRDYLALKPRRHRRCHCRRCGEEGG